jgi:hypothetical protein
MDDIFQKVRRTKWVDFLINEKNLFDLNPPLFMITISQ